ncbi:MAG TPA: hypothetical protein VGI16_00350 [Candidatus Acidoferrum sp.]|jgi:hypothetical protein
MSFGKREAVVTIVLAVILFIVQGGIYWRTQGVTRTETQKQNLDSRHRPNEIPGLIGLVLLVGAAVLRITNGRPNSEPATRESFH